MQTEFYKALQKHKKKPSDSSVVSLRSWSHRKHRFLTSNGLWVRTKLQQEIAEALNKWEVFYRYHQKLDQYFIDFIVQDVHVVCLQRNETEDSNKTIRLLKSMGLEHVAFSYDCDFAGKLAELREKVEMLATQKIIKTNIIVDKMQNLKI